MGYQLRWLLIILCVAACKLDTRGNATGSAPEAQCAIDSVACDGGALNSSAKPDAGAVPPTEITPVMTGQSGEGAEPGVGGMSASDGVDASVTPPPPPKKPDGESCASNLDCVSGHCLREICCTGGDCCRTVADCPANEIDGQMVACNEPSRCQGQRGEIRCEEFLCVANGDIPDDSACTAEHMAQDCSPYKPVYCNGMAEQEAPVCPTSCTNDTACIEEAHCDASSGTCVLDVEDGGECSVNEDCASGHCDSNICCASGDCCRDASMCLRYSTVPMCVNEATCTGLQRVAVCQDHQCTNQEMPSPIGCNGVQAERCGLYVDVTCEDGVRAQCATSCRVDTQCKREAYCRQTAQGGVCERKLRDGEPCTSTSQCQTTCNNGFCCNDSGPDSFCCGTADDCRMLERSECVPEPNTCDGRRIVAMCSSDHRCRTEAVPDPNACTNRSIDCGDAYASPAACPLGCGCNGDRDCSMGHVCTGSTGLRGVCVVDPDVGMPNPPMPMNPGRPNMPGMMP